MIDNSKKALDEIKNGLKQEPKQLPARLFYDEKGSELFDKICELDEYYLTRAELEIMETNIKEASELAGEKIQLIEFGSGSSIKTRILLDNMNISSYIPVDISYNHLMNSAEQLKEEYHQLKIYPMVADFTKEFELPLTDHDYKRKIVYFPGSTIGNLTPNEARKLLKKIADLTHGGGGLLIGIDLQKNKEILEAAYNDRIGVTAEFNLNILERINRDFGADFDLSCFDHCAFYNDKCERIEMHLISREDQRVRLNGSTVDFRKNESIVTEYSHKYTIDSFSKITEDLFKLKKYWKDSSKYFAVLFMESI